MMIATQDDPEVTKMAPADDPTAGVNRPRLPATPTALPLAGAPDVPPTDLGGAGALPLAPQAPAAPAPSAPTPPRTNDSAPTASTQPPQTSAPSPYDTPDPLAFVPLPQATTQMTSGTMSGTMTPQASPPEVLKMAEPTPAPAPAPSAPSTDFTPSGPSLAPTSAAPATPASSDPIPPGWQVDQVLDANGQLVNHPGAAGDITGATSIIIRNADGTQLRTLSPAESQAVIAKLQASYQQSVYDSGTNTRRYNNGVITDGNGTVVGYYDDPTASASSVPQTMTPGWEGDPSGPMVGGSSPATPASTPTSAPSPSPSTPSATPPGWEGNGAPGPVITPSQPSPSTDGNGMPTTPSGGPSAPVAPPAPSPVSVPTPTAAQVPTGANGMPTAAPALPTLTPTTPSNSLTNSTITPGPGVDRYAIAMQRYNDWEQQTDPQFQALERDRLRYAAGNGTIGQGATASSINDIALQRESDIRTKRDEFLGTALTGSIDDAYKNIGIAQQQQLFQKSQSDTAFDQQVRLQQVQDSELGQQWSQYMQAIGFNAEQIQQAFANAMSVQRLSDDETGAAFNRALQQFIAGNSGDPASVLEWLSGQISHPTPAAA